MAATAMTQLAVTTTFAAGEVGADFIRHTSAAIRAAGAGRLRNVRVGAAGGVSRRPGLRHLLAVDGPGRLIAAEAVAGTGALVVATVGKAVLYAEGAPVAELAAPWSADQLPDLAWCQTADWLLLTHPDLPPHCLTRSPAGEWRLDAWPLADGAAMPVHKFAAAAVTLRASARTGEVTVTASAPVFVAGHVGTVFRLGGGRVRVLAVLSADRARAEVLVPPDHDGATTDWAEAAFSPVRGWPVAACWHGDRLVVGGTRALPCRVWLSRPGVPFDLAHGTAMSLPSDPANAIRALVSGRDLLAVTAGGRWRLDDGAPVRLGDHGLPTDRQVPPCLVDDALIHLADDGRMVAAIRADGGVADLAAPAGHLMTRPLDLAYQPERRLLHVVMADGTMAVATLSPDSRRAAWAGQATAGAFHAVAVVDGVVHVLVERAGGTALECFDECVSMDAAVLRTSAVAATAFCGLSHLEGRQVWVVADDGAPLRAEVRDGVVRLDRPARRVVVGLGYTHEVEPLPPVLAAGGMPVPEAPVRLAWAQFRLLDTGALCLDAGQGATPLPLAVPRAGRLFSGTLDLRALGGRRPASQPAWRLVQEVPLPCTVLAVTTRLNVPVNPNHKGNHHAL